MATFLWDHYLYFGESRLALPLAAWIAVCFVVAGQGWRALRWTASFAIGGGLMLAAKAAFSYTGWSLPSIGVYSASGHAMLTAAVYPVLLTLLGSVLGRYTAWLGLATGVGLALFMPVVLVTDFHHTVGESLVGLGVGFAVAAVTLWRWRPVGFTHVGVTVAVLVPAALLFDPRDAADDMLGAMRSRVVKWTGATGEYWRSIDPDPATGKRVVSIEFMRLEDSSVRCSHRGHHRPHMADCRVTELGASARASRRSLQAATRCGASGGPARDGASGAHGVSPEGMG
ncbi:phosphatase [Cupriavidus sp. WKF15]|uniref:phosphatase n=1 Tax=Cupriavidus sp. WKF15 TaxID=3032282 RepID=UPI0023E32CFA|nr:phosphatase [Cupriavidus sp. WKF15]WER49577.1 phosphatase [Cupriavidus sp. WKF15]